MYQARRFLFKSWLGQRAAVDFARSGQGKFFEDQKGAWHHVVRKPLVKELSRGWLEEDCHSEARSMPQAGVLPGRFRAPRRLTPRHRDGGTDGLDFARLDTKATDLNLVIQPPNEFNVPIGQILDDVARLIEACILLVERIGNKLFGRQLRAG